MGTANGGLAWRLGFVLCFCAVCLTAAPVYCAPEQATAALLRGGLPGEDPALIAGLAEQLKQAGYGVVEIDADVLCDPARLTTAAFDLLVLSNASSLPARSVAPVKAFIEMGGDIIALNAPLWQTLLSRPRGAWATMDEYERQTAADPPENVLFNFAPEDIAGWRRGFFPADAVAAYETVDVGPAPGRRSLHVMIQNLQNWENIGPPNLTRPFPESHALTVLTAKGGPETRSLSIEWKEVDGSRWIAVVPLTTEWRRYVLAPEDFKFWESVPARRSDTFHPENAKGLSIGMAFTHTGTTPGPQEYWVGNFGTARETPELQELIGKPGIPPMDVLAPGYKFFDSHDVARLATRSAQAIVSPATFEAPADIRSIQPRPSGGGFDKGRSWRWIPLLDATTADGAWRGNPMALMVQTGAPFAGGQWLACGVSNADWYLSPPVLGALGQVAHRMRIGAYILDGGSNYYTYFMDQSMVLGARVAHVGRDSQPNLIARVRVTDMGSGTEAVVKEWPVSLVAGSVKSVSESWTPPRWPNAGFTITAELVQDGAVIDKVVHEAHVWRP